MAAKEIYAVIGESVDVSLLAGTGTETEIGVALAPGNGTIKRGTIIQKDNNNGLYVPAVSGNMDSGECAVLMHDEETGNSTSGIAGSAAAYRTGRFIAGKLLLHGGGSLTGADLLELRRQGIIAHGAEGALNNEVENSEQ